ncbi:MAG: hypothetical protein LAN64_12080 [Acidobacteriia bacterium]|nr:hypothetical protein [Terriglobia bacterium]
MSAQEIPSGTALPITLTSTLDAMKAKPGQPIAGSIAQDVPLPSGTKIRSGSRVNGQVLQAGLISDGGSYLRIRFDQVRSHGRTIPVTTSLRAIASPRAVRHAQLPSHSPYRGESPANWTTVQIGDDVVYRGGGHVMHGDAVVGDPVPEGVLAELTAESGCATSSAHRRLALWVFASSACGAYDFFDDLKIAQAGDTNPIGEIVLQSKKSVKIPTGSAMLLITAEGPQPHP